MPVTFRSCRFEGNRNTSFNDRFTVPTFENCTFTDNDWTTAIKIDMVTKYLSDGYTDTSRLIFEDQRPVIVESRTLVPLRAIFEALGATVEWNDAAKTVTSERDGVTISLAIGSNLLYRNGEARTLDVPAQIINSRTMVPVRAISEAFGCEVGWDDGTKTVSIIVTEN